jgi:alpha-glucosidase
LLALRRATPALVSGDYEAVDSDRDVLAYVRTHDTARILIALNLSVEPRQLLLPNGTEVREVLATTLFAQPFDGALYGNEGCILRLGRVGR